MGSFQIVIGLLVIVSWIYLIMVIWSNAQKDNLMKRRKNENEQSSKSVIVRMKKPDEKTKNDKIMKKV